VEQANKVDEFLKKIERYRRYPNLFYRGQSEKYSNITSSISRDTGYVQKEYAIYKEAINLKSNEFDGLASPIECLSKMQHYGIPTRLIDLSIDPLIALFFAVQNINGESSGQVYVYLQKQYSLGDKIVKLLALLATLESYKIENIKEAFTKQYSETITEEEILQYATENAFIAHTEELLKLNDRLFSQRGTFAICGNNVKDGIISRSINPLDTITPSMVIRIPYEHMHSVKKELDEKYNINETTIYPEFPSVADYLKEKYRFIEFSSEGAYKIIESKDSSTVGVNRISLKIVLNKSLRIDEIKSIGNEVIEQNKSKYDVIFIFIAKSDDDYIMYNWIIRGQWIRPTLDNRLRPIEIAPKDECNISWRPEKSYSSLSDYYAEYAFDDDKTLYVYNMKTLEEIEPIYNEMMNSYKTNNYNRLLEQAKSYGKFIRLLFLRFGEFGQSRDIDFNKYLDNFQTFSSQLDNVVLTLVKDDTTEKTKRYLVSKHFIKTKEHWDLIQSKSDFWKHKIGLTDFDYEKIDPRKYLRKAYQYTQTIPINPDALKVWFNIEIVKNTNNTFLVKGKTNLFDKASLMISIRDSEGKLQGQSKSDVKDGYFDFGLFSRKGEGYFKGKYEVNISLSIPSVQSREFISLAGLEYENITGELLDRSGIGPSINYTEWFEI